MTMNPEIKAEWLKRLRSGEYKQTTELLHDRDGFCCLGVLCEIAIDNKVIDTWDVLGTSEDPSYSLNTFDPDYGENHWDDATLPWVVVKWAGLTDINPYVRHEDKSHPISEPNDAGVSFADIADLIEEQL